MFRGLILSLCLLATPVFAVLPDEVLDDPMLEARARELSKELRCLVCRNENIDSSNADIARDLRLLVRERLVAGDSNAEARDFIVARYGEYVLLKPPFSAKNAILYLAGPLLFLGGAWVSFYYIRRRQRPEEKDKGLSKQEADRLAKLLDQ
ncbi:cytochrome c-type biogenesis protein CcmH [Amylibacter sp. IMCC11727]|uniref:cytochrome c-type biogenesis protein n=1 Tax=Amylibacter sp. IMCC11727 TaxID=3039851 RepID=UPI00244DCDF6|nr:cytochrome c-type biogenesis protein CcmH [Amylibacter sp. IMCC11727]WGI23534.1 cytochrome c-type biogenesis protein CcmH [Amylibacter sp. IMCC11727]